MPGCKRAVALVVETNWSREGVARSFGFRKVPLPPAVPTRDSRDGVARIELDRTGSLDDGVGSFDTGRGMPVGRVWRASSMVPASQVLVMGDRWSCLELRSQWRGSGAEERANARARLQRRSCADGQATTDRGLGSLIGQSVRDFHLHPTAGRFGENA